MADTSSGRRLVVAAAAMIVVGQLLAIANDLVLRQSDPSDVVLLVVLSALSVFMLRRARWARWTTVVLVALGGLLYVAAIVLLIVTRTAAGFWSVAGSSSPALASLRAGVAAFVASPAFPFLVGSVVMSALLDVGAAAILTFAPGVRAFFARDAARSRRQGEGRRAS